MSQTIEAFTDDLCHRLAQRRPLNPSGYEPVYFLVYEPSRTLRMQEYCRSLAAKLRSDGHLVEEFNLFAELKELLTKNEDWDAITEWDKENPLEWQELQATLSDIAEDREEGLAARLLTCLEKLHEKSKNEPLPPVLLVTGLEALHCFMRPGALENKLNGHFWYPTVFFYPGEKEGKTGLNFLGINGVDGNYRSEHLSVPAY